MYSFKGSSILVVYIYSGNHAQKPKVGEWKYYDNHIEQNTIYDVNLVNSFNGIWHMDFVTSRAFAMVPINLQTYLLGPSCSIIV